MSLSAVTFLTQKQAFKGELFAKCILGAQPRASAPPIAPKRASGLLDAGPLRHLARSPVMVPIPGTSSLAHLEENVAATQISLSTEDLHELSLNGCFRVFLPTRLVAIENTHNRGGGVVFPQQDVVSICTAACALGVATYLDGARLFNAAVASNRSLAELAAPFDVVSVALSKATVETRALSVTQPIARRGDRGAAREGAGRSSSRNIDSKSRSTDSIVSKFYFADAIWRHLQHNRHFCDIGADVAVKSAMRRKTSIRANRARQPPISMSAPRSAGVQAKFLRRSLRPRAYSLVPSSSLSRVSGGFLVLIVPFGVPNPRLQAKRRADEVGEGDDVR